MDQLVAWVAEHPSDAAWMLFAFLTAFTWVYYRVEPAIKRYVESTEAKWDDAAFARVQAIGAAVFWLVGLLAVLLPVFAGPRPTKLEPRQHDTEQPK